jgi:hypothetical protein
MSGTPRRQARKGFAVVRQRMEEEKLMRKGSYNRCMLEKIDGPVIEYRAMTAEDFWEGLSPQKYLFGPHSKPIFRGQTNELFKLEPLLLRKDNDHLYSSPTFGAKSELSEIRIFSEIHFLNTFARYCDSAGLRIPGDSEEFRRKYLHPPGMMDSFLGHRKLWPSDEYFEIMALAQHYGLPTRLLDWSHSSYVAAYFAASGALTGNNGGRLAVWALNTEDIELKLKSVRTIQVPGSNNANVAAQRGLFTLLRQEYAMGQPFKEPHCLDDYVVSCGSHSLAKITLPILEAPKVIDLCERYGVTAATIYPDFYGAAKATLDSIACWERSEWTDGRDIRAQTLPTPSH